MDFLSSVELKKKLKDKYENDKIQKELQEFKNAKEKVISVKQIPRKVNPTVKKVENFRVLVKRKGEIKESSSKKPLTLVEYSDSD